MLQPPLLRLLAYIRETYPSALNALQRVHTLSSGDNDEMTVDPNTLRNLEVLPGRLTEPRRCFLC